jgi:hypothetical protein
MSGSGTVHGTNVKSGTEVHSGIGISKFVFRNGTGSAGLSLMTGDCIISHLSSEDLYLLFDDTKIKTGKQVDKILPKDNPTNDDDDLWSKALYSIDSEIFWNVGHFITIVHKDYKER